MGLFYEGFLHPFVVLPELKRWLQSELQGRQPRSPAELSSCFLASSHRCIQPQKL